MHERLTPENSAFTPADTLKSFFSNFFLVIMKVLYPPLTVFFFMMYMIQEFCFVVPIQVEQRQPVLTSLLVNIIPVQTFKGLIFQKYSHCTHSTNSVRQVPYGQKLVAARALKKTVKNIHNVPSVPPDKATKQSEIRKELE